MKRLFTLSTILLFSLSVKAQSFMWADHVQQYLYAVVQVKGSAIDASNNTYISGQFNDTVDFDPGPAVNNIVGDWDFFILKLDANGNFGWVKTFNVNAISGLVGSLDIDAAGNIYASGQFYQTCDFDPNGGIANMTPSYYDTFILKLDPAGNYVWAKQIAGPGFGNATCYSMSVDAAGNVYAGGGINGTYDFDPNGGTVNLGTPGSNHGWLLKWDTNGNYVWAKEMTSSWYLTFISLDASSSGDLYVGGSFNGDVDMDPAGGNFNFADTSDHIFVAKYDGSGIFQWARNYNGDPYYAFSNTVVSDGSNSVIATGSFKNTVDFDPGVGTTNLTSNGGTDSYVIKYSSTGTLTWAVNFGSTGDDEAHDVFVDANDHVYSTGSNGMGNIDFDPGTGTYNLSTPYGGGYISALTDAGNFRWAAQNGGSAGGAIGWLIRTDQLNNIISIGNFNLTVDFDPGAGIANLSNLAGSGPGQVYVQKLGTLPNVGIEEANGIHKLKIFPNPAVELINITGENINSSTLQIININGEVVMNKSLDVNDGENITVDVSSLANGIYIIQMENWVGKVIKQ